MLDFPEEEAAKVICPQVLSKLTVERGLEPGISFCNLLYSRMCVLEGREQ